MRPDGRAHDELRPVVLEPDFTENPLASVLARMGKDDETIEKLRADGVVG